MIAALVVLAMLIGSLSWLPGVASAAEDLPATTGIAGTITGPSGPAESVRVDAYEVGDFHDLPAATATSSGTGAYVLALDEGSYLLEVTPAKADAQGLASTSVSVDVAAGAVTEKDIPLEVGNLRGTVRDPRGATVAGARVEAVRDGSVAGWGLTYDDGTFRVAARVAGTYAVTASPAAENPFLDAPAQRSIIVESEGQVRENEDFTLVAPTVTGTVTSPDGSLQIGDAHVVVTNSDGGAVHPGTVTARSDGRYGFALPAGSYRIQATPPAPNNGQWVHGTVEVTLTAEHTAAAPLVANIALREPLLKGSVRSPAGEALPNSQVHWYHEDLRLGPYFGMTDHLGRYMIDAPAGRIWIFAYRPAPSIEYLDVQEHLNVASPTAHDIVFTQTNVRGVLTGPEGQPAPGAYVQVYAVEDESIAVPGEWKDDGTFGFAVPAAGEYRIVGFPPEDNTEQWGRVSVPVTVTDPTTVLDDIVIPLGPSSIPPFEFSLLAPLVQDGWDIEADTDVVMSADGSTAMWNAHVSPEGDDGGCCTAESYSAAGWPTAPTTDVTTVIWDRDTGRVEPLPTIDGELPDQPMFNRPGISTDGRYLAFWSYASNLVADDQAWGVFVHDRETGATVNIPQRLDEWGYSVDVPNFDEQIAISDDGRTVAFVTERFEESISYDALEVELVRLNADFTGVESREIIGGLFGVRPVLSADGTFLAWLKLDRPNHTWTVEVRDLTTGIDDEPRVVYDHAQAGDWNAWDLAAPALDADGSTLVYPRWERITDEEYVRELSRMRAVDRDAGTDDAVPLFEGRPQGDGVTQMGISADGQTLMAVSPSDLREDGDGSQLWLYDRTKQERLLVSQNAEREPADRGIGRASMSADGQSFMVGHGSQNLGGTDEDSYGPFIHVAVVAEENPPTWPEGSTLDVVGEPGSTAVELTWTAATDDRAVAGYRLYRDAAPVAEVRGATTAFATGLAPDTTYDFKVEAFDRGGNQSADGPSVEVRTAASGAALEPLTATAGPGGKVTVSWPSATATGADALIVRRSVDGVVAEESEVATTATTYSDSGLAASTTFTYQVFAVNGGVKSAYTAVREVTTPALSLLSTDFGAPQVKTGLARLGADVTVIARAETGRSVTATVVYQSWYAADLTLLSAPAERQAVVTLTEEPATPGTYRGVFTLGEGTSAVTRVDTTITDGHDTSHDVTRSSTRAPLPVSGAIAATIDAPADSLPSGALQFASATSAQASTRMIDGGGVHTISGVVPVDDATLTVIDGDGREASRVTATVVNGRTVAVTLVPTLPATLSVVVKGSDGLPAPGARVEARSVDGETFHGAQIADAEGVAVLPRLIAGVPLTIAGRGPAGGILGAAELTDVTLTHGANERELVLPAPARLAVAGVVTNPSGEPSPSTRVVITQQYEGAAQTFVTTTGADGSYELLVLHGATSIFASTLSQRAFRQVTMAEGDAQVQDLQLSGSTTYLVKPRIFTTYFGSAEEGPIGFDWRTAVHMAATMTVAGRSLSNSGLRLGADNLPEIAVGGLPGDSFRLCIDGRREAGLENECGSIVLGEDREPVIEMHLAAVPKATAAFRVNGRVVYPQARLFQVTNSGHEHVSTSSWDASGLPLPGPGNYLVEVGEGDARATVAFVATEAGHDAGTVDLVTGGAFSSAENQVVPMRRDITPGHDVEFRASWHNDGDTVASNTSALIRTPANTEVLVDSITLDGTPATATAEGNDFRVAIGAVAPNGSGSLRFRVRTTADTASSIAGRVRLGFHLGDVAQGRELVPAVVQVVGLTFDAPATADARRFPISGRALPGTTVSIREAGAVLAEATASPGGFWSAIVEVGPGFGADDTHLLSATMVAGGETVSIERSVTVDSSRPVVENISLYQIDPEYGTGRRSDFDPREGVARFPFTWVPNQQTIIELTFDDPERVTVANVNVGAGAGMKATDTDGDGVFTVTLPGGWYDAPRGAIFVEVDGHPEPVDLGAAAPTKAEVEARLPWYFNGHRIVEVNGEPAGSAGLRAMNTSGSGSQSVTVKMPELGEDATAKVTVTYSEGTYTPTVEDVERATASGSQIWDHSFNLTGAFGFATSGVIPLDAIAADSAAASRTSAGAASFTASAAGAVTQVARVGYQVAFNGVTAGDSAWSAWNADEKYQKLTKALDAASDCGASAGPYLERAESLANWSAAADIGGAVLQVGSLLLAPATFGAGTVALGVLGWAFDKASGYAIDQATDQLLADIAADADCEDDEDDDEDDDDDDPRRPKKRKVGDPTWIYDPSGFVYEGITSRRITGVTATLLTGPTANGPWMVWDASWFGQQNPQTTDHLGKYAWDVPEGWWKVAFAKDGYETAYSDSLEVLPPHFDVNVSMRAHGLPKVGSLALEDDGSLLLSFSRPMRVGSVLADGALSVRVRGGDPIEGSWAAVDGDIGAGGALLAERYRFVPLAALAPGATVEVAVEPVVADYGDRVLPEAATTSFTVPADTDGGGGDDGGGGGGSGDEGSGAGDGDGDGGEKPPLHRDGYRLVAADGGVFTFGDAPFLGSTGSTRLNQPVVAGASTRTGDGYWLVASDGGVFTFGGVGFFGSTAGTILNQPIVGVAPTPTGQGYWLVARDGGVFAFGDAGHFGSTGDITLNQPIVGMSAAADGKGYWLVARDGGVFAFGSASFRGSTGAIRLNEPIVGMSAAPDGTGYWLVARDGGVFAFGSASFLGSTGDIRLNEPIVAMTAATDGLGYWLMASDGGVFTFGSAGFRGSAGAIRLNSPIVAVA